MIKVTLKADPKDYWIGTPPELDKDLAEKFKTQFGRVMPDPFANPPRPPERFASLLQEMLRIASEKALPPAASSRSFVPVSSFHYSDGTSMFTLTGIVCDNNRLRDVRRIFRNWEFANLEWNRPTRISVPVLSTKERLHLQRLLPTKANRGSRLRKRLGFLIEDDLDETEEALTQYAAFHRYAPYFMRGVP